MTSDDPPGAATPGGSGGGDEASNGDHRMGLQGGREDVCGGGPRSVGAEAELPELWTVDGVLVGVLAVRAGVARSDLGAPSEVRGVRSEPRPAALVRVGTALGRGE